MTGKDNDWRGEASAFAADAACENCGAPCDYDSEVCLCRACEVASGQLTSLTGKGLKMKLEETRADVIDCWMEVFEDIKKSYVYNKSEGAWYWHDGWERPPRVDMHGPFHSFSAMVFDAVQPYLEDEG